MSESNLKILIGLIVLLFATGLFIARPISGAGKFSLKLVQYEDMYRLCYIRGPEGILIGLAQQLGQPNSRANPIET